MLHNQKFPYFIYIYSTISIILTWIYWQKCMIFNRLNTMRMYVTRANAVRLWETASLTIFFLSILRQHSRSIRTGIIEVCKGWFFQAPAQHETKYKVSILSRPIFFFFFLPISTRVWYFPENFNLDFAVAVCCTRIHTSLKIALIMNH